MSIRIDCYLALKKKFEKQYPNAHFEVITNISKSILSPSSQLLIKAGIYKKKDGSKNPKMPFNQYKELFISEILENPKAIERMRKLKEIAKKKTLFLICYEKDYSKCHRSIIKELIEKIE